MVNLGTERRKEDRIEVKFLPDLLKKVKICLGNSKEAIFAQTLDISKKGMGLSVPVCINEISSIFITICTLDNNVKIKEQILSVRAIDKTTSRINILFFKNNPFYTIVN